MCVSEPNSTDGRNTTPESGSTHSLSFLWMLMNGFWSASCRSAPLADIPAGSMLSGHVAILEEMRLRRLEHHVLPSGDMRVPEPQSLPGTVR